MEKKVDRKTHKKRKKSGNLEEKMEIGNETNENDESESKICIPTIFNHVRTCFYYNNKYEVTLDSDGVAGEGEERREGRRH